MAMNSKLDLLEKLPSRAKDALRELTSALQSILGDNLHSLVVHGSVARNHYRTESSNIDLVVVLNRANSESLSRISDALTAARYRANVESMILVASEVARSADVFPLLYSDLRDHHLVLCGADLFSDLKISNEHIRLRIEQELRETLIRLRRVLVDTGGHPDALALPLVRRFKQVQSPLRSLLKLAQISLSEHDDVVEVTANYFRIDPAPLKTIAAGTVEACECFMNLLTQAIAYIDSWEAKGQP
jgi:predicted nucleotidyltransferase